MFNDFTSEDYAFARISNKKTGIRYSTLAIMISEKIGISKGESIGG